MHGQQSFNLSQTNILLEMAIYNGDPTVLDFILISVIVLFLVYALPVLCLMRFYHNTLPLKVRDYFLLHVTAFSSLFLTITIAIEWMSQSRDLFVYYILIVEYPCILLITAVYAYRIISLVIEQRKQRRGNVRKEQTVTKKNRLKRFFKRERNRRIFLVLVLVAAYLPVILTPVWDDSMVKVSVKHANFLPMEIYALVCLGILVLTYIITLKFVAKNEDTVYVRKELLFSFVAIMAMIAIYVPFNFMTINYVVPATAFSLMSLGIAIFTISITVPTVLSIQTKKRYKRIEKMNPEVYLEKILADERSKQLFKEHLIKEFSVENLEFYEACDNFKSCFQPDSDLHNMLLAKDIYERFIEENSDLQINIGAKTKMDINTELLKEKVSLNIFDPAEREVFYMMSVDSLPRFRRINRYL